MELLLTMALLAVIATVAVANIHANRLPETQSVAAARDSLRQVALMLRRAAVLTGQRQSWRAVWEGNYVELVAMPDGRVLSSSAGMINLYSGSPIP